MCSILCTGVAQANTITVNSLLDDVFPNASGAIFDINGAPIALATPKCTLRMAIASANLDIAVGGASNGCATGSGTDTIVFDAALNLATTPGTITLANKGMSEAPAAFVPPLPSNPALFASTPMTITGPGSDKLTIDGSVAAIDGRRIFGVADANDSVTFQFNLTGVRLVRGRAIAGPGGCLAASEHVTVTDVVFESCEAVSGASDFGQGGAMEVGVDTSTPGIVRPNVVVTNSQFIGNRGTHGVSSNKSSEGGALHGDGVGTVSITNTVFNGNSADTGGAMRIGDATSVTISGSHFIGNAATGSAAAGSGGRHGGFLISGVSGDVTINNATRVDGNVANEDRAGFSIQAVGGTVTIDTVDVSGNYVNRGGIGGFEVRTDIVGVNGCTGTQLRPVHISNVRILGNSVAGDTGGVLVHCSGALTMTAVTIAGNEARGYRLLTTDTAGATPNSSAGKLFAATDATAAQSTATLTGVTIQGNRTSFMAGSGSGFNVFGVFGLGAFTADSIRVLDNFAAVGNGGLTLEARGAGRNYVVVNSEFAGNKSFSSAALSMATDGDYTLRNSTVSLNTATGGGSIVSVNANTNTPGGVNVAIEQSTIARNHAPSFEAFNAFVSANQPNAGVGSPTLFGGGNAAITVKNSILGTRAPGFTGVSTVFFDAANGVTNVTATNTLLEWTGGAPASFCSGAGMKCNVGSLVSPLTDNGSANGTRTMALQAGSPAINAGGAVLGALTTDQRGTGFPRVIGTAVDIGAYEADPATTVGCTLDIDGNGGLDALTDGLLLIRAMFGLTGVSVTSSAIGASATRSTWTDIRSYLNANCGSSFAP